MTLQSDVDFWLPVVFVSTLLGPAAMFFSFRNQKVCSLRWRLTSPVCFGFHLPSRCLGIFMLSISFIWLAYWRSKAVASTTSHCRNKGPAKWKFYILFPWLHFIELAVRDKIFCCQARFAFRPLWRLPLDQNNWFVRSCDRLVSHFVGLGVFSGLCHDFDFFFLYF